MMRKWIVPLPIITIGRSLVLLTLMTGCGLFSIDPPVEWYKKEFSNQSNETVSLVFVPIISEINYSWDDTLDIDPLQTVTHFKFVGSDDRTLVEAVNGYKDFSISLYRGQQLVKEWEGPPGYYGDSVNSPFNYDSWQIDTDARIVEFTITEDDLK